MMRWRNIISDRNDIPDGLFAEAEAVIVAGQDGGGPGEAKAPEIGLQHSEGPGMECCHL